MSKNKRYRKLMKRAKRLQRDVTKLAHKCRLWSVGVVRCSDIVFGTRVSQSMEQISQSKQYGTGDTF